MKFKFEAMDATGREIVDTVEAENELEAEMYVRCQLGYFITKIGKVKPKKDNVKIVFSDQLPRNYWKMAFFALLATMIMSWAIALAASGQELAPASNNNGLFQEVAVEHNGEYYCFHRDSSDYRYRPLHWGDWEQWPMNRSDQEVRTFKPKKVDQKVVTEILGPARVKWLEERAEEVGVSGYYNFTDKALYDWKKFAGDSYGTYTKVRLQLEEKILDLSKWRLPILKDDK